MLANRVVTQERAISTRASYVAETHIQS